MKKTFLATMALIVAFAFTACDKPVPTNEELLTQKKGWELSTATSYPPYTNLDGETSEDLTKVYFLECELDDILYFYTTKGSTMNFGKEICDDQQGKEVSLGNWKFVGEKEEVLEFHLPYFLDDNDNYALLEAKVQVLDENTLTLRIPITFEDNPTKSFKRSRVVKSNMNGVKADPQYQFTFTYKIAK